MRQMTVKSRQRLVGETSKRDTPAIGPIDEVLGRSEMSPSSQLRILRVGEHLRKPVQLRPRGTMAKCVNPRG